MLGFTRAALRGITIAGGALAVPAIYLAAGWLFEKEGTVFARRAGLIAALGLSLSTFFASFSRIGIEGALLPALELMAIAFLWRGLKKGFWAHFVLAPACSCLYRGAFLSCGAAASAGALLANRQLLTRWRGLLIPRRSPCPNGYFSSPIPIPSWPVCNRVTGGLSSSCQIPSQLSLTNF